MPLHEFNQPKAFKGTGKETSMKMMTYTMACTNAATIELAKRIQKEYITGGDCVRWGASPIDSSLVFFYPKFTAIFNPHEVSKYGMNVDEYEGMLEDIDEQGFIDIRASFF